MEHLAPEKISSILKFKEDKNPICSIPYTLPKVHEEKNQK